MLKRKNTIVSIIMLAVGGLLFSTLPLPTAFAVEASTNITKSTTNSRQTVANSMGVPNKTLARARKLVGGRVQVQVRVRVPAKKVGFRATYRNGKGVQTGTRVPNNKHVVRVFPKKTVRVAWTPTPQAGKTVWRTVYRAKNAGKVADPWKKKVVKTPPKTPDNNREDEDEDKGYTPPPPKYDHIAPGCENAPPWEGDGGGGFLPDPIAVCTEYFEDEWSCLTPIQDVYQGYRFDRIVGYDKPYWYEMFCEPGQAGRIRQKETETVTMTRCVEKPEVGTLVELTYTVPVENYFYGKYGRHDVRSYGIVPGSAEFNAVGDALNYTMADTKVLGDTASITIPYITDPYIGSLDISFVPEWSGRPLLSWANTAMYKRPVNYEQKMLGLPEGSVRSTTAWYSIDDPRNLGSGANGITSYSSTLMGIAWDNNPCAMLGVTTTK